MILLQYLIDISAYITDVFLYLSQIYNLIRRVFMAQNSMIAMILAGGRGSRLYELTNKIAKPAVSFGGKYRIIDFPLSNCANSNINIVGVLTQYESVF